MATTIIQGRSSGTLNNVTVPYWIIEGDTSLDLDLETAKQAVLDQAYIDSGGQPASIQSRFEDLGPWALSFDVNYSPSTLGVLTAPSPGSPPEFGMNFQQEGETVKYSPYTLDWGPTHAPNLNGLVGVESPGWGATPVHRGVPVSPRVTHWSRQTVTNSYLTPAYMQSISQLQGTLNSERYWMFEPGCARLVSMQTTQRDDDSFNIYFGFDYRKPVPARKLGGDIIGVTPLAPIDVPAYDGWDIFWTFNWTQVQEFEGGFRFPTQVALFFYIEDGRSYFGQADWESVLGFQPQVVPV